MGTVNTLGVSWEIGEEVKMTKGIGISVSFEMNVLGKDVTFIACITELSKSREVDAVEDFAVAEIKAAEGERTLGAEDIKAIEHFLLEDMIMDVIISERLNDALANNGDDGHLEDEAYHRAVDDKLTRD